MLGARTRRDMRSSLPARLAMWRWRTDWEQVRGALVLAIVIVALGWALAMCFVDGPVLWRAVVTVVLIALALLVASAEWQPRTLGVVALSGVVLLGLIALGVGRSELERRNAEQAVGRLDRMAAALGELEVQPAGAGAIGSAAAWDAILLACARAADESAAPPNTCSEIARGHRLSAADEAAPASLPVAMDTARLRLAEYRQSVLGRPQDGAEVEAAGAALATAIADVATEPQTTVTALAALSAGGDAIVQYVIGDDLPLIGRDPPLVIETAGWILLAFAALMFWRVIAKRSFGELPGPVTISLNAGSLRTAGDAEMKIAEAAQRAAFRVAVLRNVTEPGALPGATAIQTLTDLLEVPGLDSWFAPVVNAVKTILAVPRGFKVSADVVPPESTNGRWVVLVRVTDLDSGKEVAVSTQTGDSDTRACRSAGYWAAAVVLSRSTRIPSWAGWDSQTSTALALYDEPESATPAGYVQALAKAPSSGVLLQKLAAAYALDGLLLESISMSARAVAAHPRYHVACYRLAGGINMLADRPLVWMAASLAERRRILGQLERALSAIRATTDCLASIKRATADIEGKGPPTADFYKAHFRGMAMAMFRRYRRDLRLLWILGRSLRRSERDIWWPRQIVGRSSIRSLSRWTVRSALLICEAGSATVRREEVRVIRGARRPSSHFQLSYNLACHFARRGDESAALTWLEASLERANSWQITDGWLDHDPDLRELRGTARYAWVAAQVRNQEEVRPDADEVAAA